MADSNSQTFFETTDVKVIQGYPIPTRQARKLIVAFTLTFCAVTAALVTIYGDPTNSLHSSAQAWAFGMSATTIFAYVFGAVIDNSNVIKSMDAIKKTNG